MDIVILDSAYKHGITKESIYSCLFNFKGDKLLDYPPVKRLFAGFDQNGTALELVGIEDLERDRLIIFHAMKLQKKYHYLLRGD